MKATLLSSLCMMSLSLMLTGCHTAPCCTPTATAAAPAPAATSAAAAPTPAAAPVTLAGQWTWTCCEGNYKGEMTLQQDGGKITGRIYDENDTTGGAVEGTVTGNTVTFARTWGEDFRQDYALTLSADGNKLAGKFDGTQDTQHGNQFEAIRK